MKKGFITTSDKARIYYEDVGSGDPIVFVPGFMCTTKFFAHNVEAFSATNRVVCMDNRGFGNSSKPLHGNSVDRHADDIRELIEQLDLERVTLVGWSLSGNIVVSYAAKYKCDRLKCLGIIDSTLFAFSPEPWNTYGARDYNMDVWNAKNTLWYTDFNQYIENFVARMSREVDEKACDLIRREIVKTPPWIGLALHSDWCHTDSVSLLTEITVPVIFFTGLSEGHGFEMGRHYQSLVKTDCELHEFEKGGHIMFMAFPDLFNRKLGDFINKHS